MAELLLQRADSQLIVTLDEYTTTTSLAHLALTTSTWKEIYEDAPAYGRKLFDAIFPDEQMRTLLASLPKDERLLLVAEDPLVASIPWEYLRDQEGKLLASRLSFVRGLPAGKRQDGFTFHKPLEIVAVPASPVDEEHILNVEGEWSNLIKAVRQTTPLQAVTLKRVRPPTRNRLKRVQGRKASSIIHFMGHGASRDGKTFLVFEDARACSHLVDAVDFADALEKRAFLVVLNSCLSAMIGPTEFGNIAHTLVQRGVPYALGMQFIIPDEAALVLSETLYGFLLQGYSVEEAVTQVRNALEEPGKLAHPEWLAGIPTLYTSLRTSALPFELTAGKPDIQPDPDTLQQTCDLTALPQAQHFLGRTQEMSKALGVLLAPSAQGFVLLHGLGGIGKTSLARALAERVSWYYDDRVLTYSFETFARLDQHQQRVIDETFADRFFNRLARFYGLDLSDPQYQTPVALQQAILQQRTQKRSLLVLDNIETLFDAQGQTHPAARILATFLHRLREGNGVVLLTSRQMPPADWGTYTEIALSGLSDHAGADLFAVLLPPSRRSSASPEMRQALSHRVQGHPLSLRLLAARFAEHSTSDLETFLKHIQAELEAAEQRTPTSLEDPERQRTLYACLAYSIKRLTPEQEQVLRAVSLFQAPFPAEFVEQACGEEQTQVHLQTLVHLSLIEGSASSRTFPEGDLLLLELHPMVRWYIQQYLPEPEPTWQERYGAIYAALLVQASEAYDNDARLRTLVRLTLPDSEAALLVLPPASRSALAYRLAKPYERLGQNRRALALYEQSLRTYQELGDVRSIAVTQHAMADVLVQQGKPQEGLALYEQSLRTKQALGDVREIAVTQHAMADVLVQQGKPQEALALYEQSLRTDQALGDVRGIAVTQANLCQLLLQTGETARALGMAWDAYSSLQQHGYVRDSLQTQQLLVAIKWQTLGEASFNSTWEQVIFTPQPDWLREGRAEPVRAGVSAEMMQAINAFINAADWEATQAVVEAQHDLLFQMEVEQIFEQNIAQAQAEGKTRWTSQLELHLALLRACKEQGIVQAFAQLLASQQEAGAPANASADRSTGVSAEIMQAINAFVNAADWEATQAVVEEQHDLLFQAEVEQVFERNIAQARTSEDQRWAVQLKQHLELLRVCKATSIAEAFEQLRQRQHEALPFDEELLVKSVAALLGNAQEKLAFAHYLAEQQGQTTDEQLQALYQTLQLALFGGDRSQLGRDLQGVYRQVWEAIAAAVEADGIDSQLFELLASNTRAVLGPAAQQRNEWRSTLADTFNQATAAGNRNMAMLLNALIGLLDADGNPAGLGEGLQGIYARMWQGIVTQLPQQTI